MDAEDFLPVTETYPAHPISSHVPLNKTTGDLRAQREKAYKDDIIRKQAEFAKHVKQIKPQVSRIPDEGYVANPEITSIKQRSHDKYVAGRKKAGLTDTVENPKAAAGEPSLAWNYKPDPKTCAELLEQRRVKNLQELKALEPNIGVLKNSEQRLNEREMCFLRMQQKEETTKTHKDITAKRRREMIDENTEKFGE